MRFTRGRALSTWTILQSIIFGTKIKYQKLLDRVGQAASAFAPIGVASGGVISIVGAKTPELIYAFYAASRIGAVVDFIDPHLSSDALCISFEGNGYKVVMSMDVCENAVCNAAHRYGIATVIRYAAADSLSWLKRVLFGIVSGGSGNRRVAPFDGTDVLS